MKKEAIKKFFYYLAWGVGFVAAGVLIYGIIQSLI